MYITFENSYGDLTSIGKMEKRIIGIYPEIDTSSSGIISLVNRYKYLDIYPCSIADVDSFNQGNVDLPNAMKVQGASASVSDSNSSNTTNEDSLLPGRSNEKNKFLYARPDFSQLMSFKPDLSAPSHPSIPTSLSMASGMSPLVVHIPQSTSGGTSSTTISITIAVPDLIAQFVNALPNAATWQGPIADVDQLLALMNDTPLPNPPPPGATVLDISLESSNQPDLLGKKRKDVDDDEDDSLCFESLFNLLRNWNICYSSEYFVFTKTSSKTRT